MILGILSIPVNTRSGGHMDSGKVDIGTSCLSAQETCRPNGPGETSPGMRPEADSLG
jgi:hypothetical protein